MAAIVVGETALRSATSGLTTCSPRRLGDHARHLQGGAGRDDGENDG